MEIQDKISSHESKLVRIETILERVVENQDRMANSIEVISEYIGKQELLLEKLANLETNVKGSIERIHKRLDDHTAKIEAIESIPNKLGMRALYTFVAGIIVYLMAVIGLKQ